MNCPNMMMARKLLTRKKAVWADQFKPAVLRGKPLRVSAGLQARYQQDLEQLVAEMTAASHKEIVALFESPPAQAFFAQDASLSSQARIVTNALIRRVRKRFALKAKAIVDRMVAGADKASSASLHSSLRDLSGGLSLKTTALPSTTKEILASSVAENVGLIKSIADRYLTGVQGAVMRAISSGNGLQDLIPYLREQEGVTKRRARNIALDQTRKVYNGLNNGRCVSLGVTQGEWVHSGGGIHPRERHLAFDGKVFNLARGAPVGPNGAYVRPGEEPNCKCSFIPVIRFSRGDA